jgi:hypothetical protein
MFILAALCVIAGVLPAPIIDHLAPIAHALTGGRMPSQNTLYFTSIVPIEESRSSYNPLILFAFMTASGLLAVLAIHRFATRATRRGAIWDCGYPDPSVATQYSSSSMSMPIRRVFAPTLFGVREIVDMPSPGQVRGAHYAVRVLDPAWRWIYGPLLRRTLRASVWINQMQFQTVRRYLTLVFIGLIALLVLVAIWR